MNPIVMNVENIATDSDVFTSNSYLVLGENNSLVDTGAMDDVIKRIEEHTEELDTLLITHQHTDHVANLEKVVEVFEPDIYSYEEVDSFETYLLDDGDEVRIGGDLYTTLCTPGHADDHVSFIGDTAVFSGDVVVYNDDAFSDGSFGRTDMPGQSRELLIDSIDKLLEHIDSDIEYLFAGHGDVYQGDVVGVFERALERASRRQPKYG